MRANYAQFMTPQLRILSDDQMEDIHLATLELLESVGVFLNQPEALALLDGAGAYVVSKDRVKIPSFLVEEALRSAPRRIGLANRDGQRVMFLEDHKFYFGPELRRAGLSRPLHSHPAPSDAEGCGGHGHGR